MRTNKYFYIILFVLASMCQNIFAQEDFDIKLKVFYTGNNVLLRWYPQDYDTYVKCAKKGFAVERRQVGNVEGWQSLGVVEIGSLNEFEQWESKDSNAGLFKYILYKDELINRLRATQPDSVKVLQNYYKQIQGDSKNYLYGMMMLSTEFSVDLSRLAAVNFMDEMTRSQQTYEYRVSPIDKSVKVKSEIVRLVTNRRTQLMPMSKIEISRSGRSVRLKWPVSDELEVSYSGYQLERSEDGIHYKKINRRPIVHVQTSERDKDTCAIGDSLPECGKRYYYRVKGMSGFGFLGDPSNVVSEQCVDPYTVKPILTNLNFNKDAECEIEWGVENPDNQTIKQFVLERAERLHVSARDTFVPISKPMSPNARAFTDKKPLKNNYYRVAAYGETGQIAYSNIVYKYPSDTLPPSVPTGLKGVIDSSGVVTLTWNPNPEPKIRGYRVHVANDTTEQFLCCTDTFLKAPMYTTKLFLGSLTNDIYYKVQAVGDNYGYSALTPYIKLMKPDTIPPAKVVFDKVGQDDNNVMSITWYDSPSIDVAKIELYRMLESESNWVHLQTWNAKKSPEVYVDSFPFMGERVAYSIKVYDESDNMSQTDMVPYRTKILRRHCLKGLKLTKDVNRGGVFVDWKTCGCRINSVRVFRSDDGGPSKLIKTVNGYEYGIFDNDIKIGHEYKYTVLPITEKMSEPEVAKIKY